MLRFALLLLVFVGCARVPVVPPSPEPDVPVVDITPVPAGPLRVVIWRETDIVRTAEGHLQQFYGPELQGWFKAKGVGYRIWDQHVQVHPSESDEWEAAAKIRPKQIPWIVATNGAKTVQGPLPMTAAETIKLLEPLLP